MARDGLKLDSAPISEAKGQVLALKSETESLMQRVSQIKSSLSWEVLAKENIDGNLQAIIDGLNEQIQFMDAASTVCDSAITEAEEGNTTLIGKIAQLILLIKGILGITSAATAGAVIGGVIGAAIASIANILTSGNSSVAPNTTGTGSESTNVAQTDGVVNGTREERVTNAQNQIQQRATELEKGRPNDPTYYQECSKLTYDQLKSQGLITDGKETWYSGKSMAKRYAELGTTSTGAKCTGYNSFDEMLASNNEPITNVICSFDPAGDFIKSKGNGHSMLISRIEDGNVYFVDNRKSMCVRGTGNDHLITQCMSVQEFKNLYYASKNKPNGVTVISKA